MCAEKAGEAGENRVTSKATSRTEERETAEQGAAGAPPASSICEAALRVPSGGWSPSLQS